MSLPTHLTANSRDTAIGRITLLSTAQGICALQLPGVSIDAPPPLPGSLISTAFDRIDDYLAGRRRSFELPLLIQAKSAFARRTLAAIAAIPYGQTRTYGELGPARAVGRVCATNPLPLLIPCHRVLPSTTPPGHYRGGTALKSFLLSLEAANTAQLLV